MIADQVKQNDAQFQTKTNYFTTTSKTTSNKILLGPSDDSPRDGTLKEQDRIIPILFADGNWCSNLNNEKKSPEKVSF